jgi:hypothetical protein
MRRIAAMAGLIALVVLALAFLWRVYQHHEAADPDALEAPALVRLDEPANSRVRIARELR